MVWAAALALLAAATAEPIIDTELVDWAKEHAPDGLDFYPDGSVWVSAGYDVTKTEYMLSAKDMRKSDGKGGYIWMRMDHSRDKTIPHRSSMRRYYFNCTANQFQPMTWITYNADKTVRSQGGNSTYSQYSMQDVIPGSIGEHWMKLVCFAQK